MKRPRIDDETDFAAFRQGEDFANTFMLYLAKKHKNDCISVLEKTNINNKIIVSSLRVKVKYIKHIDNDHSNYNSGMFIDFANEIILIKEALYNVLKNCLQNKNVRHTLLLVHIIFHEAKVNHTNILIFDNKKKTVERFEPHGWEVSQIMFGKENDERINILLTTYFEEFNYRYIEPSTFCPTMKAGPQILSVLENKDKMQKGFCQTWSLWYADFRLTYPDISINDVSTKMTKLYKQNKQLLSNFIINFAEFVYNNQNNMQIPECTVNIMDQKMGGTKYKKTLIKKKLIRRKSIKRKSIKRKSIKRKTKTKVIYRAII
jgi:hypothetical protein